MSEQPRRVIVIGGGVIGATSAYYLQKAGCEVTIVDRGRMGKACSHGNCGLVCPSHVLPLAEPGAVKEAIKALTHSNSPFRIQPRLDMRLWLWLWQFSRRCNRATMVLGGYAIQALLNSSLSLYEELMRSEPLDCEWQRRGILFAYLTKPAMDAYAATDSLLREKFHEGAERLDGEQMRAREPALKPGLAGGWFYEHDAHLRPDKLMSSWRSLLQERGATLREECSVKGFVKQEGKATAIQTAQGELTADAFVVATGALTPLLESELGCKIPIQPGKGYSLTMPRPARCPTMPIIFPEHRVVATPFLSGYRLGSMMEFAGYDTSIRPERLALLREGARPYLEEPECEPVQEEWYGWRPMTWDSLPIIDRSPGLSNVLIAAGHNMLGLSMAPATGKLIREILFGEKPHVDPAPYSVKRF